MAGSGVAAMCVSRDFDSRTRGIDLYVRRLERAYSEGHVSLSDLKHVYAGGMLRAVEYLEQSLSRLFIGLVNERLLVSGVVVRVRIGSPVVAREVLLGGKNYVDWLPYRYTKERAEVFLRNGHPFTSLTGADEQLLERVRIIRNAVAHGGDHAMRVFERQLVHGQALPPTQHVPEGYLRGQHAGTQSRFNYLLVQCSRVVRDLCS